MRYKVTKGNKSHFRAGISVEGDIGLYCNITAVRHLDENNNPDYTRVELIYPLDIHSKFCTPEYSNIATGHFDSLMSNKLEGEQTEDMVKRFCKSHKGIVIDINRCTIITHIRLDIKPDGTYRRFLCDLYTVIGKNNGTGTFKDMRGNIYPELICLSLKNTKKYKELTGIALSDDYYNDMVENIKTQLGSLDLNSKEKFVYSLLTR